MSSDDPLASSPLAAAVSESSDIGDSIAPLPPTSSVLSTSLPTSTFFTPTKPPHPPFTTNGHLLPSTTPRPLLPHSTPSLPTAKPPVKVKPASLSLEADPLLHPLQPKDGLDDSLHSGGSGGTASPAPRLSASLSSSDLSSSNSPATSPSGAPSAFAPLTSPTSASTAHSLSSSAPTSNPSPLTSSHSASGLSSWFSSFSSSISASRDIALIASPPEFIPNYFVELSAFLHTQSQHPSTSSGPPPSPILAELTDKLPSSVTPPPSHSLSTALSDLDGRRKQFHTFTSAPLKKKVHRLQKMLELNNQHILDLKHLIVRARKKCDAGYEGLLAVAERLRSWYLMNEFNLLQEGMHLQDELFDNYEDMCKASILALREKNTQVQATIDALMNGGGGVALSEFFFLSSKQVCMLNPVLPDMMQRQATMASRLSQVKVEYVAVSKVTEEEEKVGRHERIARVIADFYASYKGDLKADYSPARALEYEFSRFCLDERTKEGQMLKKWMEGITAQADGKGDRLTHHSILVWMRKFESNFAKEYNVGAQHRLYLRLLIQRMLFPRIWDVCCIIEEGSGDSKEKDEVYVAQSEWLRCVKLEQLGVTAPFLMSETIKQAVMQKMSAGSSRWSKGIEGGPGLEEEKGVGGGQIPRELPTALKELLHLEGDEEKEGAQGVEGPKGVSAVEGKDEFDRLFVKGGGGGDRGPGLGGNFFDKFDKPSDSASPSVSPSPSSSPLSTATSTQSSFSSTSPATDRVSQPTPPTSSPLSQTSESTRPLPTVAGGASSPSLPLTTRIQNLRARSPPLPARLRPYLSCIECLEDISHLTTPLDMLQCLLAVARNIYKTATEYSQLNAGPGNEGKKAELGADSFFPIWVYVLIQSEVKDLHRRMRMMKEYGVVKTEELNEHEYYLTCMEGGLVYVREADPDKY